MNRTLSLGPQLVPRTLTYIHTYIPIRGPYSCRCLYKEREGEHKSAVKDVYIYICGLCSATANTTQHKASRVYIYISDPIYGPCNQNDGQALSAVCEPNAHGVQPKIESRVERLPKALNFKVEISFCFSAVASSAIECWE